MARSGFFSRGCAGSGRGLTLRQQDAIPLITELKKFLEKALDEISGKSTLAKAIRYALARWTALTRYTTDGRLEMTNNAVERAIRPLAMTRKNYGGRQAHLRCVAVDPARAGFKARVIVIVLVPARPSRLKTISMPRERNPGCARRSRPASARRLFDKPVLLFEMAPLEYSPAALVHSKCARTRLLPRPARPSGQRAAIGTTRSSESAWGRALSTKTVRTFCQNRKAGGATPGSLA
jgi:hypothetical protein